MTLGFTRVTPAELERAYEEPEWAIDEVDEGERPGCFLEKSWAGIQFLLNAAGVDVDLYEDGDPIDDESVYWGWHERKVATTAKLLGATPFEVLASHYDLQKLNEQAVYPMRNFWGADDIEYLRENYVKLVQFFEETAALGDAALRDFSF